MVETNVKAILIVEIVGRPANHVKESLVAHVNQLNSIKGVKMTSMNVSEPKEIQLPEQEQAREVQPMYTCFAEVEITTENLSKLIEVVFDYMPASVEIIEPNDLDFNLSQATAFLNDLAGRLHKYDEIAKISQMQTQQLAARFQQIQQAILNDEELRKKFGIKITPVQQNPEPQKQDKSKLEKKVKKKPSKKKK